MMLTYQDNVQLATEKQLKDWLTSESTLKIIGVIDEVNLKMSPLDLFQPYYRAPQYQLNHMVISDIYYSYFIFRLVLS